MARLLLIGATGLVGSEVTRQALRDSRVNKLVTLTRRPQDSAAGLENHVVDFDNLPDDAPWWSMDAVVCTLGRTLRTAGSTAVFWRVDHDYPLEVARRAREAGTPTFALNSALSASARSPLLYSRTKGKLEEALQTCGFDSLTFVRPGLIGGQRNESRPAERLAVKATSLLAPALPRRFRVNPAENIAKALLDAAIAASPGVHVVDSRTLAG